MVLCASVLSYAEEQADAPVFDHDFELARTLTNPIAAIISVPVQTNADFGMGTNGDGSQYEVSLSP